MNKPPDISFVYAIPDGQYFLQCLGLLLNLELVAKIYLASIVVSGLQGIIKCLDMQLN